MDGEAVRSLCTTHIGVLVFTEVIHGVYGVFLEFRKGLEKLCDVSGGHALEGGMLGMGELYRVTEGIIMFAL